LEDLTQKAMGFPNFLLLAHLLARQARRKESLINYSYDTWNPSKSFKTKTMDKGSIVDRIKEVRHKKKEKKKTLSMAKCTCQRTTKRHYNAFFCQSGIQEI
jgi:hypothetical protein